MIETIMQEKWENKPVDVAILSHCKGHTHTKKLMCF